MNSLMLILVAALVTLFQSSARPVVDFNEIEEDLLNINNKREPALVCDDRCQERNLLLRKLRKSLAGKRETKESEEDEDSINMSLLNNVESSANERRSQLECDEQCQELERLREKLSIIDSWA